MYALLGIEASFQSLCVCIPILINMFLKNNPRIQSQEEFSQQLGSLLVGSVVAILTYRAEVPHPLSIGKDSLSCGRSVTIDKQFISHSPLPLILAQFTINPNVCT